MIYVNFKVDKKLKKIISLNKKYSLQEASLLLSKVEIYAKDNNYRGVIEYSILEDNHLLFRDNYSVQEEKNTNIILLVRETLDTVFKDYPQEDKNFLLEKLAKSITENSSEQNEEERKRQEELKLQQEEEERKRLEELKLQQEEEERKRLEELKLLEEKKQVERAKKEFINDIKKDFKKEFDKEFKKNNLLKKYIKTNENLKKARYIHHNRFNFGKVCLIVCVIIIGYFLYNSYIINGGQASPIWISEINSKLEAIKDIILN